ncbi:MAG: methyltransferase domain-containing protein [Reyranella sp.]|nr:methyltransferase domain-containing protein [Reyranella sp.]
MQSDVFAEVLKRRGVAKVCYFHADHFEPWGSGLNDDAVRAVEHFAQQTRTSPYASKLSLFYSTYVPHRLDLDASGPTDGHRAPGDKVIFAQRSPQQEAMITKVIRPLCTEDEHEMHLHVHHEWWTRNDSHFDSPISNWVNAHSTGELDQLRLDLFFSLATDVIARETGEPFSRWGFVHGNWALAGSDRRICQIKNELSMIMKHGGFGDFSFPAGRSICDPRIETPFTCLPLDLERAYDLPEADAQPVSRNTKVMSPDRFFIWNSKIKANYSSLDYYYGPNRDRFQQTDAMVDNWLTNSVVIGDCLFVKTHAHSMYGYYKMADPDSLVPHRYPDIVAVFDRLARACDNAGVELQFATVNEVMDLLHAVDGTTAPSRADEAPAHKAIPAMKGVTTTVKATAQAQPVATAAPAAAAGAVEQPVLPSPPAIERPVAAVPQGDSTATSLVGDDRLSDPARAILRYVKDKFASDQTRIVQGGQNNGPLAVQLAGAGFDVVVYEPDPSAVGALKQAMEAPGPLLPALQEKLQPVHGQYPEAFTVGVLSGVPRSLFVASEMADASAGPQRELVLASLAIFDDVIVCVAPDSDLHTRIPHIHEAIERVWTSPSNDVLHLRPRRVTKNEAASAPDAMALPAKATARAAAPMPLDLATFDAELVGMQRAWMAGAGKKLPHDDGYAVKVERNAILQAHERAIASAVAEIYDREATNIVEIGSGCGALALLLARHGFHVLGFEGDRRRHPASQSHLAELSRLHPGLDQRVEFIAGFFPDVFSLGQCRAKRKSVCIATNLTHSYTAKNEDLILRTASVFDELIVDLGRFGVNRDSQEERDRLLRGLVNSHYEAVELLYEHGAYEYWRLRARRTANPADARRAALQKSVPPATAAAAEAPPPAQLATDFPLRDGHGVLFTIYGEQKVAACPVCNGSDTVGLWRIPMTRLEEPISLFGGSMQQAPTRHVPAPIFCYDFCRSCDTVFMNPVPQSVKQRYRKDDYYIAKMAKPEEWRGYEDLYDLFAPAIPANAKVMLDAACGIGQYLRIAQRRADRKWERLVGLDLSEAYVKDMQKHDIDGRGIDLDRDDLGAVAKPGSVDFITFCEAFDQMERPLEVLKKLLKVLRPAGRLFFTAQRYGKDASGPVRPSEHLYVGQKLIEQLPARLGCRVKQVTTSNMRYYVMLEK